MQNTNLEANYSKVKFGLQKIISNFTMLSTVAVLFSWTFSFSRHIFKALLAFWEISLRQTACLNNNISYMEYWKQSLSKK